MDRLTVFPDIYPSDNTLETEVPWSLADAIPVSVETLVLSWASLLHAYTGEEQPVFTLDQSPVKVDLAQAHFDTVSLHATTQPNDIYYTSIVLTPTNSDLLQTKAQQITGKRNLYLSIDLATGAGFLRSEVGILPDQLKQIGLQLFQFVKRLGVLGEHADFGEKPLLSISNPEPRQLPGPQFLHHLAFSHAGGDALALEFLNADDSIQSLSFRDLDYYSTRLAQQIAMNIDQTLSNRIVPVLLGQSVDLYIAWLAVLKAGAAFCPLGIDSPEDRINFILKDVAASVVVTHSRFQTKLENAKAITPVLVDEPVLEDIPAILDNLNLRSEDLAYVMYTSGSTGRPKGVTISHKAVTQSLLAHNSIIPSFHRFLQFASPTFDVSVFEVFFPWFRGATLVGAERGVMLRDLGNTITALQADAAELTPTVAAELLRSRQSVPRLRVLLTIGEMLTKKVVDEFGASATSNGILHSMYGPTEAAIHCTAATHFQSDSTVNLIGQPLETVSAFVMSLEKNPPSSDPVILPIGQIGELVVGGPQLAQGYINRPVENAKAFLRNSKHGRLYRTGDKARILPDGRIECLGRISAGQVKLRGQRVELGEIESVICLHPNIHSAIVGLVRGILIAWVLIDNEKDVQPEEIRRFCQKLLPTYMVPGDYVTLGEFPRLDSGKVNKKALEADYDQNYLKQTTGSIMSFRDSLEERIYEAVGTVLGTFENQNESLSAMGLDSLTGIRLAAKLREISINLDVGTLLVADTVSNIWDFAKETGEHLQEPSDRNINNIWESISRTGLAVLDAKGIRSLVDKVEPCSDTQIAMLSESLRDHKAYCNWVELRFQEGLQLPAIEQAISTLIKHNEMLRSVFLKIDVPENPFCRVAWKRANLDDYFQEKTSFDYDWSIEFDDSILIPFKVQFIQEKTSVRVLVQLHHAIYDGWSWELVLDDLRSALAGEHLDTRLPFSNVVRHYLTTNSSQSAAKAAYWEDYIRGAMPSTLPLFQSKIDVPKRVGKAYRTFNTSLLHVDRQARSLSISRQAFFQASVAYILSSYLDTDDVIFGTVFSGRTLPVEGIENTIGPCLRIFPNRVNLSWVRTIHDLLIVIQRSNRKTLEYGNISLRQIKKLSGVDNSTRLFDCLFVWQELPGHDSRTSSYFEQVAAEDFLEFPLVIELEPKDGKVMGVATYEESVFPEAQANLLLEQIDEIATLFTNSLDSQLNNFNHQLSSSILSIENNRLVHLDDLTSLAYQVEQLAAKNPRRNAVEFIHDLDPDTGGSSVYSLTYHELNQRSNRLAHYLLSCNVRGGDLVGIILDKSLELYISILAVIKIGAGYVPLTPLTPNQRVRTVLDDTRPRVCIVTPSLISELKHLEWLRLLDLEDVDFIQYSDENPASSHQDSNAAYVVYTSGSTGKPKGVVITHRNLQSNIATLAEIYPIGDHPKLLQACSQAFDVSVFEIFFSWHCGMTLCSATNDVMFRDIEEVIRNRHVTHLSLTPTVAALIKPENVPSVRMLVTAGEGLTAKVHHDWAGMGLYQGYGPSETTNICTVRSNVTISDNARNIGKPFKNTSVFVTSEGPGFSLLLRGAVGEFCFGGDQVGQGYLNQPSLTREKFFIHPEFGRLYRSGDFGRLLPDGSLMFVGRRDDQVKLRGQRVELGEINSAILFNSEAQDCASMIVGDKSNSRQQLVSFFVPRLLFTPMEFNDELKHSIKILFESLTARLSSYMVPSYLIPVEAIPMTIVKKIDNRKLKDMFEMLSPAELEKFSQSQGDTHSTELSEDEEKVANIISQATKIPLELLRPSTSLYNVGIDSISAIHVSRLLRKSGFGQVDVSLILRHSSIGALSRAIRKKTLQEQEYNESQTIDLEKNSLLGDELVQKVLKDFYSAGHKVEAVIPCTALQEAMLSRTISNEDNAYCNHILLEFKGDFGKLRDTMQQMACRHEVLRTCFVTTNNARFTFVQAILQTVSIPWTVVETTDLAMEILSQKSLFATHAQQPFTVPYSIVALTEAFTDKKVLLFSIHHALHDGQAMALLLKEIETSYAGGQLPVPTQFRQFVNYILANSEEDTNPFWNKYLDGIPGSLLFPSLTTDPMARSHSIDIYKEQFELPLTEFETMCKNLSVTPLSLIQGAWAMLLSIYTTSSDICFGNVFSGRTIPLEGIEDIIGPCFSVLPVRFQVSNTALSLDVVKSAHKANIDIMAYQHTSLRQISKKLSGKPLFDSIVLLQPPVTELDHELWQMLSEEGDMDFPVILEILPSVRHDNLSIHLHVNSRQVTVVDAKTIIKDFTDLVIQILRYPLSKAIDHRNLRDLPTIAQKARDFRESIAVNGKKELGSRLAGLQLSDEELRVRDIISRLSGCDPQIIKHDTTIFQLGLDSINAIQISAFLKDAGYLVSAADILENPSTSGIANLLQHRNASPSMKMFDFASFEKTHREDVQNRLNLEEKDIESIRPCTSTQAGMLAEFTRSNGDLYCNRLLLKSTAPIDLKRLKSAWSNTMARHEMLRTGFIHLKDRDFPFAMVTYSPGQIPLPWTEYQTVSSNNEHENRRKSIHANLHLPPWLIFVRDLQSAAELDITAMHAIYDAQSMDMILSDVARDYQAQSLPRLASISPVLGQILNSASSINTDIDNFWSEVGSEFQITSFPNLNPVNEKSSEMIETSRYSSAPLDMISERCRAIGVTLQAAGQAAWARLLSAYTGETNVSFGLVLSGRDISRDAQNVSFPCLVTLPFRCLVEGSNRSFISSIMKTNASFMKHQFTPFTKIQKLFKADGGLVDTLFAYQKFSHTKEESQFWEVVEEDARVDYPISMEMVPDDKGVMLRVTCRGDVVPQSHADLILRQFDHLLLDCLLRAESSCRDISTMQRNLLSITPAKESRIPSQVALLHEFVESSAQRSPNRVALEFVSGLSLEKIKKETWTYSELDRIGNKVARLLQTLETGERRLIAICFDKCPEAYFAILGILKGGHAFVALDPSSPLARKQFIVEDSAVRTLLCTSDKHEELNSLSGVTTVELDKPGILDDISADPIDSTNPIYPDDTCYCLYTSGTTGTPKGCEITHDNAVQAMQSFSRLFDQNWDEDSRWLQFASFHFDVSVLEQYWSWGVGICVTSCPRDLLFQDLAGTMKQLEISHVDLTPSLAKLITPEEVPSLCKGVFITGGEALKQEILDAWGRQKVIYNGYGPTEVTIGCTMLPRMDENSKSSNIGAQFDNVGSYVFQPGTTTPVLRGGIGELCVSGALVGRGYLNRPELTREKFQYIDEYHERVYRTGDLVRILHDYSFQFLGRIDDQVKIRGQRLEIGEINAVIQKSTPEIAEVATLVIKHPSQMREQLVSFIARERPDKKRKALEIVEDDNIYNIIASVQEFTQAKLSGYMVPTHIIPISALPLSANNKVEMKALRAFYAEISLEKLQQLSSISRKRRSSCREDVRHIVRVLADFSKVKPNEISHSTSIYDLGLDSISVIGLAQKFRDAGYVGAHVSLIMKNPSVAGIASALKSSNSETALSKMDYENCKQKIKAFAHRYTFTAAESIGVPTHIIQEIAPCTPLQAGMIARFLESSGHPYCSLFRFELNSDVDLEQLRSAWSETQENIQLLRVRMVALPDGFAQVFLKHDEIKWLEITATDDDILGRGKNSWKSWCDDIQDFSGPLWCIRIIKSSNRRLLCLNIFHALYDGNSLPLLLEQVTLRYHRKEIPDNIPSFTEVLPRGPLRELPEAKDFWTSLFNDLPAKSYFKDDLPSDSLQAIILTRELKKIDGLVDIKASLQVTDNAIFHACWLLTLALDIPNAEYVVGPLFNTIPSYISFHSSNTKADLIKSCHHYYVSTLPYQHTPLRDIGKWLGRKPNQPLFEILFVYQKSNPTNEEIWSEVDSVATVDYPLSLEVQQSQTGNMTVTLAAKNHAVSADEAESLLSTFERICKTIHLEKETKLPSEFQGPNEHSFAFHHSKKSGDYETVNSGREHDWTPDMTEIRSVIAELACVDAESIHLDTSIFELGLDSIDAVKLSSRLRARGISLPVSSIMNQRTVLKISNSLSTPSNSIMKKQGFSLNKLSQKITASLKQDGKLPVDVVKVLPPTALQEAMVAEMIMSEYQHYYTLEVFEVVENVDFSNLLTSWKTVVDAHDILRTTFVEVEDPNIPYSYAQIVHAPNGNGIEVIDLRENSIDNYVKSINGNKTRPSLSIQGAQTDNKRYIILSIAHALYDGWSFDLLHTDIEKAYLGHSVTRPPYEGPLEQILTLSDDSHRNFWDVTLKGFIPRRFPRGTEARGDRSTLHRLERSFNVPCEDITQFCKKNGVTVQALSLATWCLTLASFVRSLDVGFGLVLSGRNFADANEIMFPTMNTVVFRAILHGSRLDMLKYIQSTLGELSEHQYYPLRKASTEVAAGSLFDTIFIYQKRPTTSHTGHESLYKSIKGSADTGYPLSVEMELEGDSMISRIAARDDLLGLNDAADVLEKMSKVFHLIMSEPQHPTVDFTDNGVIVCQSAVFQEKADDQKKDEIKDPDESATTTTWTDLEICICETLSILSGIPRENISKDSTLFNLGLDSISAIKVCTLLKHRSVILPVTTMLKAGSIKEMAKAVKTQKDYAENPGIFSSSELNSLDVEGILLLNKIPQNEVEKVLPATSGQIYCLAMHAQNPQIFYPSFFYSVNSLSSGQLDKAWTRLVSQLPILRTIFIRTGIREIAFAQAILKESKSSIFWHETASDAEFLRPKQCPIASGPVSIHATGTNQGILINLHIHHALYDAISLPKIIDCLGQLCSSEWLHDRELDFSKFIQFQGAQSLLAVRKQFWRSYLSGMPGESQRNISGQESSERSELYQPGLIDSVDKLETVARHNGLSLQSIFIAVYSKVHAQLAGNASTEDLVLGVYLANRGYELDGLPDLIAPTLNMVPLRIRSLKKPTIEIAHQIQSDLHEISRVEHSGVSLVEIMDWTGVHVDVFVNFLRLPESGFNVAQGNIRFIPVQREEITSNEINGQVHEHLGLLTGEEEDLSRIYRNCFDIEVGIREGKMDVGIFGSETVFGEGKAGIILDQVRKDLEQLVA
ncbi:nonribosomal siderophore peptide synthase SidC [Talaromyces proteolyticus]|uniref:Nonribosomal peptide synthetase sidC n=1 Tax=Talaromyces proteolyticus TaxID=1131652 RepID=A0AAD4KTR5_9EURO|nr:nonribosomal siderophore peptide synthase SidC [Talaromyces proteolyticus]KAH8695924.1 nonribosomal siderophore peptide synthase SidC [Talaromyces proteolyticus]